MESPAPMADPPVADRNIDLTRPGIWSAPLPATAAAYPAIRYADPENVHRGLFSRVGWFPRADAAPPHAIYVLFLGAAEAIEKHAPAIADINARGSDILVFEFAGQGRSGRFLANPRKVHAAPNGFDLCTYSLMEFLRSPLFRAVRQRGFSQDRPLVAVGYSLGGHFLARAMFQAPVFARRFQRLVYVNPVVAMNTASTMAWRIAQQLIACFSIHRLGRSDEFVPGHGRFHPADRPLEKSGVGSDPERHAWLCQFYRDNPQLTMWGMTYGWFHEANRSLMKLWDHVLERERAQPMPRLITGAKQTGKRPFLGTQTRIPTLVISSMRDTIVVAHYVQRFAKAIGADLLVLATAKHEPTQEPPSIREATLDAVAAWVRNPDDPGITDRPEMKLRRS